MGQITIYLDARTESLVKRHVKQSGQSASGWIAEAVKRRLATEWPLDILKSLGTWKAAAFPDVNILRDGYGRDAKREVL